jgi:hypothetical protein
MSARRMATREHWKAAGRGGVVADLAAIAGTWATIWLAVSSLLSDSGVFTRQ